MVEVDGAETLRQGWIFPLRTCSLVRCFIRQVKASVSWEPDGLCVYNRWSKGANISMQPFLHIPKKLLLLTRLQNLPLF